jgi:hypothetical protein
MFAIFTLVKVVRSKQIARLDDEPKPGGDNTRQKYFAFLVRLNYNVINAHIILDKRGA